MGSFGGPRREWAGRYPPRPRPWRPFDMYRALLRAEGHHKCKICVSEEDELADVATKTIWSAKVEV